MAKLTTLSLLMLLMLTTAIAQAASSSANQVERITLQKTEVIGSQELPRIVSIMSWKKSSPLETSLINNGLQMNFNPIDKKEFSREIDYRRQLQQ